MDVVPQQDEEHLVGQKRLRGDEIGDQDGAVEDEREERKRSKSMSWGGGAEVGGGGGGGGGGWGLEKRDLSGFDQKGAPAGSVAPTRFVSPEPISLREECT